MKKTYFIGALVVVVAAGVGGWWYMQTAGQTPAASASASATAVLGTSSKKVYSEAELEALASNKYASGSVPLGDYKYVTSGPKQGYIYLCNVRKDNPGSKVNGPWIHGDTWNFLEKLKVSGAVSWPQATFASTTTGSNRTFTGNGLPVGYTTGIFPVSSSDGVAKYDPNPNTISAQVLNLKLPKNPTYLDTPQCMGMEVGITLSGVPLFNAFDAGLRDAPAHEAQDLCDAHPQGDGEYHYHSLSNCFKDIRETTVLGYALDGFPITGPVVAKNKYLTTADLDVCHGITSQIMIDGKLTTAYHYVMTYDFPYSVSCFRGKPVGMQVEQSSNNHNNNMNGGQRDMRQGMPPPPPFMDEQGIMQ